MAEITLRAYMRETDDLIEHEQLDEAIAHCRHVLQTFPKHLQTYRLLGKAYVEAKRYGDAADLFQRVLSSVPDDFVAHVGMSIVREDEGNLDAAIWHMERAYETNPAHPAIQQELRKLIGRRDGLEPHKARLTRGALARMYAQGELFSQGVAELRAALKEDPDRPDLQVLLAEMYFRLDQRAEAVDVCNRILEKLPYCRDANRIMATILHSQGRTEEAATYVRRLAALDPYAAFAESPSVSPDSVDAGLVRLEKLTWQRGQAAPSGAQPRPDWVAPMGVELREKQGAAAEGALPAWLQPEETTEVPAPKVTPVEAPPIPPTPPREPARPGADIPEWMKDAGWSEATGQAAEAPVSFSDAELEALEAGGTPPAESPLAPAEIPGWLKDIAPEAISAAPSAPAFARGGNGGEEELPPWLGEIAGDVSKPVVEAPKTAPPPSARAAAEPKKLTEDRAGIPTSKEPPTPAEPIEERILPPWLEQETPGATSTIVTWLGDRSSKEQKPRKPEAAGPPAALPGAPTVPISAGQAAPPDWLSGLRGLGEIEATAEGPEEEAVPGEVEEPAPAAQPPAAGPGTELDWLRNLTSAGREAPGELPEGAGGAVPDWLTVPYEEMPEQFEKAADEGGVPLGEEEAVPSEQPEMAGTYDWLRGFEAGEPEPVSESTRPPSWIPGEETPPEAEGEPEIARAPAPDWLRELASSVEGAPAVPEAVSETPDWLKGILDEGPSGEQALPEVGVAAEAVAGPSEPAAAEPAAAEAVPDWLKGLAGTTVGEPASAEAPESSVEWLPETPEPSAELAAGPGEAGIQPPSWERIAEETTSEAEMGVPLAMAEAPDWLKELSRPEGVPIGEGGVPVELPSWADQAEAEAAALEEPLAVGETPDWLRELVGTEGKPPEEAAPSEQVEQPIEVPAEEVSSAAEGVDWLEAFAEPATTPSASAPAAAPEWLAEFADRGEEPGEAPSWLTEATPWQTEIPKEAPATRAQAAVPTPEAEEGVPDWLLSATEEPTQYPAAAFQPAASEIAGVQEEAIGAGMEGEGLEDTEIFQWLEDIAGMPEGQEAEVRAEPIEPIPAEEIPEPEFMAWTGLETAEVPPSGGEEESFDWLQQLAEEGGAEIPVQTAQPEGAVGPEEISEVPEWLLSMEAELAQPPAAGQQQPAEAPIWLEMLPEETPIPPDEVVAQPEMPEAVEFEMGPEVTLPEEQPAAAEAFPAELPEVMSVEIEEAHVEGPAPVELAPVLLAPLAPTVEPEAVAEAPQPAEAVLVPVTQAAEPLEQISPVTPAIPVEEPVVPSPVIPPSAVPPPEPRRPVRLEEMLASEPAWLRPVSVPPPARPAKAELGVADWLLLASKKARTEHAPAPSAVPRERVAAPIKAEKLPRRPEVEEERKPALRRKAPQAGASDLLASARKALESGDLSLAVEKYGVLIRRKMEVHAVIQDLKTALGRTPRAALLWQALGDAYMRGNQVAEAAEAYRHGMEAA